MSGAEILESVQYVVNNQGQQTAVQLDLALWKTLRPLLEEVLEDKRLGELMLEVKDDERLEGEAAHAVYQVYLAEEAP